MVSECTWFRPLIYVFVFKSFHNLFLFHNALEKIMIQDAARFVSAKGITAIVEKLYFHLLIEDYTIKIYKYIERILCYVLMI